MTDDMFGTPESVYKEEIARLEGLIRDRDELVKLYHSVNKMMCKLGADGEINSLDETVLNVMDDLHQLDGGTYDENKYE